MISILYGYYIACRDAMLASLVANRHISCRDAKPRWRREASRLYNNQRREHRVSTIIRDASRERLYDSYRSTPC